MTKRRARPRSRPKLPAITPEQKAALIKEVRGGLDPEAAIAEAGLDEEVVRGDRELLAQVAVAFKTATAKLRAKLIARAVVDGESHILERAVAARDAAAAKDWAVLFQPVVDEDEALLQARLEQLSDDELHLVEWVHSGEGERPTELLAFSEWMLRRPPPPAPEPKPKPVAKADPEPDVNAERTFLRSAEVNFPT